MVCTRCFYAALLTAVKVTTAMALKTSEGLGITAMAQDHLLLDLRQIITQTSPAQGPAMVFLMNTPNLRVLGLVPLLEDDLVAAVAAAVGFGLEWEQVHFWDTCLGTRDANHRWDHHTPTDLLQHHKQVQEHVLLQVSEELKEDN